MNPLLHRRRQSAAVPAAFCPWLRRKLRTALGAITATAVVSGTAELAPAAAITWIGGNANWDAVNANWSPADEPDANDEAIFSTSSTVNLANAADTILALTLSGGIDLNTNGNDLTVDGLVQLTGSGTNLFVGGSGSLLLADSVSVNSGGTLRLTGGAVSMVEESGSGSFAVAAGGTLSGNGAINLNDGGVATGTTLLTLNGTLAATSTTTGDTFGTAAATLTINLSDADARIDLDQGASVVNISRNDTLAINGVTHGAADPYSGTLNLSAGATLEMSAAWQTDTGTINVNTVGIGAATAGAPATIAGAAFSLGGGTINLDDIDSLRFSALFNATGGAINNAGLIIFNAGSTIGTGTDFQMTGNSASLTVEEGVTVNIDDADFDADSGGAANNIITINNGGVLDLDLGAGADESLSGIINLNGGELDVTTADNTWQIDAIVTTGADTGTSLVNGAAVTFTNATVIVSVNSRLDVNASNVWSSGGNLDVKTGGVARLIGSTTFNTPGAITGAGTLLTNDAVNFATATVINMPGGTVDLDGGADSAGATITVNANTTINAGTMASFGNTNIVDANTLALNQFASLTVNLTNPADEWTINPAGRLEINAVGGNLGGSGIQGSDFNMEGIGSITGNSIWTARTDISGRLDVALNGSLSLRGGTLTDTNRLRGGSILGFGRLRALTDEALVGFGLIQPGIEFATNTELLADDGMLRIDGPILDVGVIGTADDDGILNVTLAWNTNVAGSVNMEGGEIRGATITNGGADGISGDGLISARVINTTEIQAHNDGTLVLETAANNNDWDGAAGTGVLNARGGNLELRDDGAFPFTGTVAVNTGREVFANGFELEFDPGSTLTLSAGTYRSTHATDFGGMMSTGAGGESTLLAGGPFTFENGSATTLNSNLRLDNTPTVVQAGAGFTGGGALLNLPVRTLRLLDGIVSADLGVLVQNEGLLRLGLAGTAAQVQGTDFQQAATGTLLIELGGVALNAFDRLNLSGAAALSGTLNLSLIGGFVPALGQTFNILTATGGISGTFSMVSQPAGMPAGLALSVTYSPFIVQLSVVPAGTPYESWINSFGSITNPADKLKGANPDGDELNNLAEFALDGNPASGLATGKVAVKIAPVGGTAALTITLPVRNGATPDPADPAGGALVLVQTADGLTYTIQASEELANWTLDVTEVTGGDAAGIQTGLPALSAGWVYRTFRSPGPVAGDSKEFMRCLIGE